MTLVKCNHWCKNQENGICTREQIEIHYLGNSIELMVDDKPCLEFDSTKCECGWCEHSENNEICTMDGHKINDDSKCTNGKFSVCQF